MQSQSKLSLSKMSLSSPWVLGWLLLPSQFPDILHSRAQQRGYRGRNRGGSKTLSCLIPCASPAYAVLACRLSPQGPRCQPRATGCNTFGFLPTSSPWLHSCARGCRRGWQQVPPSAQETSLLVLSPQRLRAAGFPAPLLTHRRQRGQVPAKAAGTV